jgi:hypothetical protein
MKLTCGYIRNGRSVNNNIGHRPDLADSRSNAEQINELEKIIDYKMHIVGLDLPDAMVHQPVGHETNRVIRNETNFR